jgi:NAD(P)-dependent dehydrogenase (short-subunit alcohol dehydrogenase family)
MILKDKIAIITGASSGIGQASAFKFADEGATVVVADIKDEGGQDTVQKILDRGGKAIYQHCDVSVASQVKDLITTTAEAYGRIDILFNNAGMEFYTTIAETTEEQWDKTIDIDLKGTFLGMKFVLPFMKKQGYGTIVNMASVAGLAAWPGLGVYSAAKGGVVLLTKATAAEYGKFNIRVNCLCPGSIRTPLLDEQFFGAMEDPAEGERQLLRHYPLNRLGSVEEVANAALFLASDSSSFITGQALAVDGGISSFVGDLVEGR